MSLPRYPEYRDSGVEWLGEVPAHWEVSTLRRVTLDKCDGPFGSGIKSEHYTDEGALVVRLQNIRAGRFHYSEPVFLNQSYFESELRGHEVLPGDVLVAGLGDENNLLGRACVAPAGLGDALVKADCFRFRVEPRRVLSSFVAMQLSAGAHSDAGTLSSGTTRSRIPLSTMQTRRLVLPPLEEQAAIAAFLDRETAKIDALIAEQDKLLALLAEKRQATISHAVTKGLNPEAPMKDSGVEWLGEVPAHWEVGNLKRFAEVIDCKHHTVEFLDDGLPIVSIRELRDNRIDLSNAKLTSPSEWDFLREGRIPQQGDLIFCRNASVGAVGYVGSEQAPFCMGQDVCLIRPQTKNRFMHFQITCRAVTNQIEALLVGATIRRANVEEIRNLLVTRPPAVEQEAIATFLTAETARLDALTTEATRAIALLKERRSALISAAVTGKIDVRYEAAQPIAPPCL